MSEVYSVQHEHSMSTIGVWVHFFWGGLIRIDELCTNRRFCHILETMETIHVLYI